MPVLHSEKNCVRFFTDFSADASQKYEITLHCHLGGDIHLCQKFHLIDICFSLPRSIRAIAEKRTRKIAGTCSSKFVFYGIERLQKLSMQQWFPDYLFLSVNDSLHAMEIATFFAVQTILHLTIYLDFGHFLYQFNCGLSHGTYTTKL